ncbi:hypothetical protein R1flu_010997 [Riccia fluitans]|uniref:Reverse transcriptase zinc-binding domain-containing protein n=1 Tax=Riccia fluitans TaxID=41844 RepID=A0ABD1Z6K6_9MARC
MGLWKSDLILRDKFWVWRILQGGFFLNDRVQKMKLGDGICIRCGKEMETTSHCFFECKINRKLWQEIIKIGQSHLPEQIPTGCLAEWIDGLLRLKEVKTPLLLILVSFSRTIWKERCLVQFENRRSCKPIRRILQESSNLRSEIAYVAERKGLKDNAGKSVAYLKLIEDAFEREFIIQQCNRQRFQAESTDGIAPEENHNSGRFDGDSEMTQSAGSTNESHSLGLDQLQNELRNLGFLP